jgi:hypothetical protein
MVRAIFSLPLFYAALTVLFQDYVGAGSKKFYRPPLPLFLISCQIHAPHFCVVVLTRQPFISPPDVGQGQRRDSLGRASTQRCRLALAIEVGRRRFPFKLSRILESEKLKRLAARISSTLVLSRARVLVK